MANHVVRENKNFEDWAVLGKTRRLAEDSQLLMAKMMVGKSCMEIESKQEMVEDMRQGRQRE